MLDIISITTLPKVSATVQQPLGIKTLIQMILKENKKVKTNHKKSKLLPNQQFDIVLNT